MRYLEGDADRPGGSGILACGVFATAIVAVVLIGIFPGRRPAYEATSTLVAVGLPRWPP